MSLLTEELSIILEKPSPRICGAVDSEVVHQGYLFTNREISLTDNDKKGDVESKAKHMHFCNRGPKCIEHQNR